MAERDGEVERRPRDPDLRALLQPDDARALYGPGASDDERRAAAARLRDAAAARLRDAARMRPAAAELVAADAEGGESLDAQPTEAADPDALSGPPDPQRSPWWRRAAVLVPTAALLAVLAVAGGYALGSARQEPGLSAAGRPTPSALPTVLYLDDRDGEVLHLEYRKPGDPRSVQARLPEMLVGWSMATACLSRNSRPRTVPTETVLLLDGAGRQLDSWSVPCDSAERRYFAIPAPAHPTTAQLIVAFDDRTVSAAWATIDPNR